jgi:hypothetical protein
LPASNALDDDRFTDHSRYTHLPLNPQARFRYEMLQLLARHRIRNRALVPKSSLDQPSEALIRRVQRLVKHDNA